MIARLLVPKRMKRPAFSERSSQLAVAITEAPEVTDHLTDSRGVDVVDLGQIQQYVPFVSLQGTLQGLSQKLSALSELDDAFYLQQAHPFDTAFVYEHGCSAPVLDGQSMTFDDAD